MVSRVVLIVVAIETLGMLHFGWNVAVSVSIVAFVAGVENFQHLHDFIAWPMWCPVCPCFPDSGVFLWL